MSATWRARGAAPGESSAVRLLAGRGRLGESLGSLRPVLEVRAASSRRRFVWGGESGRERYVCGGALRLSGFVISLVRERPQTRVAPRARACSRPRSSFGAHKRAALGRAAGCAFKKIIISDVSTDTALRALHLIYGFNSIAYGAVGSRYTVRVRSGLRSSAGRRARRPFAARMPSGTGPDSHERSSTRGLPRDIHRPHGTGPCRASTFGAMSSPSM